MCQVSAHTFCTLVVSIDSGKDIIFSAAASNEALLVVPTSTSASFTLFSMKEWTQVK